MNKAGVAKTSNENRENKPHNKCTIQQNTNMGLNTHPDVKLQSKSRSHSADRSSNCSASKIHTDDNQSRRSSSNKQSHSKRSNSEKSLSSSRNLSSVKSVQVTDLG